GGSGYQQIRMNDNGQFLNANGISTADGENTPVGFQPINLNNLGQVVGVQPIYNGTIQPYHAQLWTNGNITDLGPSAAFGINDQGDVVGSILGDPIPSPFIWTPSGGQQPLDGVGSAAVINNARQIAGPYGYWASPSAPRQSIELDAVYDINSAGQVVGSG